jgi:hypothetical protein
LKTTSERIRPQAVHHRHVRKNLPMKPRENSLTFHPCSSPTHRHRQVRWIHRWMVQEPNRGFSTPQNYLPGKSSACTPTQGRSITVYQLCRSSQISARRCVFFLSYGLRNTSQTRFFLAGAALLCISLGKQAITRPNRHGSLCSDSRQTSGNTPRSTSRGEPSRYRCATRV